MLAIYAMVRFYLKLNLMAIKVNLIGIFIFKFFFCYECICQLGRKSGVIFVNFIKCWIITNSWYKICIYFRLEIPFTNVLNTFTFILCRLKLTKRLLRYKPTFFFLCWINRTPNTNLLSRLITLLFCRFICAYIFFIFW